MKKTLFIKHIKKHGCKLFRQGAKHEMWINTLNNKQTAVPRHNELDNVTCREICKQLDIPKI